MNVLYGVMYGYFGLLALLSIVRWASMRWRPWSATPEVSPAATAWGVTLISGLMVYLVAGPMNSHGRLDIPLAFAQAFTMLLPAAFYWSFTNDSRREKKNPRIGWLFSFCRYRFFESYQNQQVFGWLSWVLGLSGFYSGIRIRHMKATSHNGQKITFTLVIKATEHTKPDWFDNDANMTMDRYLAMLWSLVGQEGNQAREIYNVVPCGGLVAEVQNLRYHPPPVPEPEPVDVLP